MGHSNPSGVGSIVFVTIVVFAMCAPAVAGGSDVSTTATTELVVETQDRIDDDGNVGDDEDTDDDNFYGSIQAAVDAAPSGALINVTQGIYNETVIIDKPNLVIVGDTGNSLPGTAGNAPTLDSDNTKTTAFKLTPTASNVVIEGFQIQKYTTFGVFPEVGSTETIENITISDNNITNVPYGVPILNQNDDATFRDISVLRNKFSDNTWGINIQGTQGVSDMSDVQISENLFRDSSSDSIQILAGLGIAELRNITITENTIYTASDRGIELLVNGDGGDSNIKSVDIRRNMITNADTGIMMRTPSGGELISVDIYRNDLQNNRVGTTFNSTTTNDIRVNYNVYEGNTDLAIESISRDLLQAKNNWYGENSGPSAPSNPDGSGDAVSQNVTFDPFLSRTIQIENGSAPVGEKVRVDVAVDAADVAGYELGLDWNESVVNLTDVEGADLTAPTANIDDANGTATFTQGEGYSVNKPVLATLVFNVTAEGKADISIDDSETALFDFAGETIDTLAYDAGTVESSVPGNGDVNGDGTVNAGDVVLLQRYIVGHDVTIDLEAADVDGDGDIDPADVIAIKKKLVED